MQSSLCVSRDVNFFDFILPYVKQLVMKLYVNIGENTFGK